MLILGAALAIRPRGVMDRPMMWTCVRIIAAGVLMGEIVLAADDLSIAVQVAIGIVAYGAASLAFSTVTVSDIRTATGQAIGTARSLRRRGNMPSDEPAGVDDSAPDGALQSQAQGPDQRGG